jgi:hypothetical protein
VIHVTDQIIPKAIPRSTGIWKKDSLNLIYLEFFWKRSIGYMSGLTGYK